MLQKTTSPCAVPSADPDVTCHWKMAEPRIWRDCARTQGFVAYQQTYEYGDVLHMMGAQVRRVCVMRGERLLAVAQIQLRQWFARFTLAVILRGPVWATPDLEDTEKAAVYRALDRDLRVGGVGVLMVLPERGDGAAERLSGMKKVMTGHHTSIVNLDHCLTDLQQNMTGKWRNRLRTAQKTHNIVLTSTRRVHKMGWLLDKEEAQQKAMKYRALPTRMVPVYAQIMGKASILLVEAKDGATRIGGMLFLCHADAATYHIGWANELGKKRNVHNLLLWEAIVQLRHKKIKALDLGGLDTERMAGIARFKLGVGGAVLSHPGMWTFGPRWRP